MNKTEIENEYYTPEELALKLNVSLKSIRTWTQNRRIPGQVKIGRIWRYRKCDIEKQLLTKDSLLRQK